MRQSVINYVKENGIKLAANSYDAYCYLGSQSQQGTI